MVHLPREYYVGWFVFVISRHFEESVGISIFCMKLSLPKKRKGPNKFFMEDAAILSGLDEDEDQDNDEDSNE